MQKFILLGNGYSEIFAVQALIEYNHTRIDKAVFIHHEDAPSTFVLIMKPVEKNFQALYTILRGLRKGHEGEMYNIICKWLDDKNIQKIDMSSRDPRDFHEEELYYQYIIGVLRLNHIIPPLQ